MQVGGGLRGVDDIAHLIAQGIDRVVLGTAAIHNPALVRDLVEIWGEKIVIALDARDGQVATQGWTVPSSRTHRRPGRRDGRGRGAPPALHRHHPRRHARQDRTWPGWPPSSRPQGRMWR